LKYFWINFTFTGRVAIYIHPGGYFLDIFPNPGNNHPHKEDPDMKLNTWGS